jgi:hypothetical protein
MFWKIFAKMFAFPTTQEQVRAAEWKMCVFLHKFEYHRESSRKHKELVDLRKNGNVR